MVKLIIIIAHRLKTTEECDYLLLEDGILTDQGTYQELSNRNQTFKDMIKV